MTQQADSTKTTPGKPEQPGQSTPAPTSSNGDKKASLRGMDFDQGEKALKPDQASPKVAEAIAYNEKATWANAHVADLQALLKSPPSGKWDAPTVQGVVRFQTDHGLESDGKVGPNTKKLLSTELGGGGAQAQHANDTKGPADTKGDTKAPVGAKAGAPAPTTPAPAETSGAQGPLKPKQIVVAQAEYRKNPFAPAWVAKLQAALETKITYVMDSATIQKVAEFQGTNSLKVTGFLRTDTLPPLLAKFPTLAEAKGGEHERAQGAKVEAGVSGDPIEDKAARATTGQGMAEYVAAFQTTTFLGKTVVGRPEFVSRINAAKSYLTLKLGKGDPGVAKQLGSTVSNSYRPSAPGAPQAYHGMGQALDIDQSRNPWVVGNPQAKSANDGTVKILGYAARLMGHGEGFDAKRLHEWAQELPTDQLWETLESSNTALREYRQIANDPGAIKAAFDARMASAKPLTGAEAKLDFWLGKVPLHHKMLLAQLSNWHAHDENLGFMDQSKELVIALRDVAGLRWGATDMGDKQSSDMMHWDNHHDGKAKTFWSTVNTLRASEKTESKT